MAEERKTPEVVKGVLLNEISGWPYNDYKKWKSFEELELFRKAKKYKPYWTIYRAIEMNIEIPKKYARIENRLRAG